MYDQQQQGFGQPPMGPVADGGYGQMPTEQERQFAMFAHIGALFIGFWAPVIFMFVHPNNGQPSAFVKHHAKQSLVWCIALIVVALITCGIGAFVMMIWQVIAGLEANKGNWYVYPGCSSFVDRQQ